MPTARWVSLKSAGHFVAAWTCVTFMTEYDADHFLVKKEKMPDGQTKLILKSKTDGKIIQKLV